MEKEYCLVTGASSGLGLEFCKILAEKNKNIVMIARNPEQLKKASEYIKTNYEIKVISISADLSNSSNVIKIYEQLKKENIFVSVLINNAGIGTFGNLFETDWKEESCIIDLNAKSLVLFCKLFGKEMKEKNQGKILNVASMASFLPDKKMAVYNASKSFVLSFTYSLFAELNGSNVTVTALCPGPVNTNFISRAKINGAKVFNKDNLADSAKIAQLGIDAMENGKLVEIPGIRNWLIIKIQKILPIKLVNKIYSKINY